MPIGRIRVERISQWRHSQRTRNSDRNASRFFSNGAVEFLISPHVTASSSSWRWSLDTRNLSDYFIPRSRTLPREPSELANRIRKLGKGIGYKKTVTDYVFENV